jgi:hypothetical protein
MNGSQGIKMEPTTTNRKSRQRSSCGLSHAQMTAAKIAELESAKEAGTLTTLRHLYSQLTTAPSIEKAICNTSAPTATNPKRQMTLPRNPARLKPKSLWPDLRTPANHSTSPSPSQNQPNAPGTTTNVEDCAPAFSSLFNRMMQITDVEFP